MNAVKYLNMDTQQLVDGPPKGEHIFDELINVPGFGGTVYVFSHEFDGWYDGREFVDQAREVAIRAIAAERPPVKYLNMDTQQLEPGPPKGEHMFDEHIHVPGFDGVVYIFSYEFDEWYDGREFVDQGRETAIRLIAAEKAAKARPVGETFVTLDDLIEALREYDSWVAAGETVSSAEYFIRDALEKRIAARNQTGA